MGGWGQLYPNFFGYLDFFIYLQGPLTIGVPKRIYSWTFIIYHIQARINDFSESTKKFDFIIYADDTTLSSTINSFNNEQSNVDTQTLINVELSKIIEWLNINKLSLNKKQIKIHDFSHAQERDTKFFVKIGQHKYRNS